MLNKQNIRYLSPLALLTLSACGGSSTVTTSTVSGAVVKGPLSNALAFLDLNKDGVQDSGEPNVRTSSDGSYSLSTSDTDYNIVAVTDDSTVDTSTGAVLAGVTLSASKDATVITPMTTLMEQGGLTVAQVAAIFQLPAGVDPLSFNPFAAGADPASALAMEKVSQQIMTVVTAFASAAEGAGGGGTASFAAAMKAVVDVVKTKASKLDDAGASAADKTLDLTSTADLARIQSNAETEMATVAGVNTTAFNSLAADTATAVKNVNAKIDAITDTDLSSDASKNIFTISQVLASQTLSAATDEAVTPGSGSIDFTDATAVNTAAANNAPTDITLSASSISELATSLIIGTLATTDSDQTAGVAFTYSIAEVAGTDYASFSINQATGELSLIAQPDYETKTSYSVTILSTDEGGKTISKGFTVEVTDEVDNNAFGIKSNTIIWTDYDPLTGADVAKTATSSTSGTAVTFGAESIKLNLTNLENFTDDNSATIGKAPALRFTLDSVPTESGSGTITATITDGNNATRSGTESQLSLTVDVEYTIDGDTAVLSVPAQAAPGSYTKSDGAYATFNLANGDIDAFSITAEDEVTGFPASLDVKLGVLYDAFVSGAGDSSLLAAGTYNLKVETTLPLQDADNNIVTSFSANVELGASATEFSSDSFGISSQKVVWMDYDPATAADITNTIHTSSSATAMTLGSGSVNLNLTNLENLTDDDAATIGKTPELHFYLDSVPSTSGSGTVTATITDGNNATRSGTESQLSLTVDVEYTIDGDTAVLSVPAQAAPGSYTKSDGAYATFNLANGDIDAFSITAGDAVTGLPASLDVKMGALYDAFVSGAGDSSLLAAGTYHLKLETTLPLQDADNNAVTLLSTNVELVASTTIDTLTGTAVADTLTGGATAEVIDAGKGADTIATGAGADKIVIRAGDGASTVATNTISDFIDGTDKFQLNGDLEFTDLTIEADTTTPANAVISTGTGASTEYLMVVAGVAASDLTDDDFIAVDIA
jgi:hypothetical protein